MYVGKGRKGKKDEKEIRKTVKEVREEACRRKGNMKVKNNCEWGG
jgi:hypothetical protein